MVTVHLVCLQTTVSSSSASSSIATKSPDVKESQQPMSPSSVSEISYVEVRVECIKWVIHNAVELLYVYDT